MRVWVTRDEKPDGPLSAALWEAGLSVVHEPVLERRVVNDAHEAITKLGPDDWLVLTSVYAIEAGLDKRLRNRGCGAGSSPRPASGRCGRSVSPGCAGERIPRETGQPPR